MFVIHYGNLTWTEVNQLQRDLPVVLPFGNGYALTDIAEAVGSDKFILLPALPYGWKGSLVDVGPLLLCSVVDGIFSAMREEGFTRPIVVCDRNMSLDIPDVECEQIPHKRQDTVQYLNASPERVVLISTGHVEQHGYHLPMNTDTVIIEAITAGTVRAIPDKAEMLPVLPYGVSTHRSEFAGTFNMGGRLYEDFMLGVIAELVRQGADRFYLMSGHGGNCSFLVNVVKYAGERHTGIFAATTWLHTSGRIAGPLVQQTRRSARGGMGHAGELETAYMLYLRPELCRMEKVVDETEFISTADYYMDWIEGGALVANPPWGDDTFTGSYGAGSLATPENGKFWLKVAIQEKVDHVLQIHEQQDRRIAKRASNL